MTWRMGGLGVGLLAALAVPAGAGGLTQPLEDPLVAVPVADAEAAWQGPYAGISLGKPFGDNVFGRSDLDIWSLPADWTGTPVTLKGGYDWQRGRVVYGVALDLASGDITNPTRASDIVVCFTDCEVAISGLHSLRGRVGIASGRTLVYATAGLARADVSFSASGIFAVIGQGTLDGWTAGLGVERRLGDHLSLTAEYRHTDLGVLPLDCFSTCQTSISFGLAEIGVNYRW